MKKLRRFRGHFSLIFLDEVTENQFFFACSCAGLTAYNCLYGPEPLKGGDVVLTQGTGGVSMYASSLQR